MTAQDSVWTEPQLVAPLIRWHFRLRPQMQVQDAYKLLYQGVRGSEHLLPSGGPESAEAHFTRYLQDELESLATDERDPLFESIHPAGALLRLNLKPFKARRGDLSLLVAACLTAARQPQGTVDDLRTAWGLFSVLCQQGEIQAFPLPEVHAFTARLEEIGYPAFHHSPAYRQAYKPSYRLVAASDQHSLQRSCS